MRKKRSDFGENSVRYKHGMFGTPFYYVWNQMKQRCYNKNVKQYDDRGGRGIIVCDRRLEFKGFMEDMYESYLEHTKLHSPRQTTIDREDNDGCYCKENCSRKTMKEQSNKRRNNIVYEGKTIGEWSKIVGKCDKTIYRRIKKGMDIKKAIFDPLMNPLENLKHFKLLTN